MADAPVRVLPVRPKALTVSEFNRQVKSRVEEQFPSVWIEGEIAQLKVSALGHAYFDLKDPTDDARVSCCFFKGSIAKSRAVLREGEHLVLRGKGSLYAPRGSFQFIVDTAVNAGGGSAAAALEALKRKLADEGLFAAEKKRRLPKFPRAVGVVTARTGAAFADIARVLSRRWPTRIVLANTLVQGTDAPAQIAAAIAAIQRVEGVDVVIVGRGGGASEDLAAFNDERVARAIAACKIPVISAVGHEVDHTVADLVADVRAATPSNAAELAVCEMTTVVDELSVKRRRLESAVRGIVDKRRVRLQRAEKLLGDPSKITNAPRQRIDEALTRMAQASRKRIARAKKVFGAAQLRLEGAHPKVQLAKGRSAMGALEARLARAAKACVRDGRSALGKRAAQLDALSPLAILGRGYAVVLHEGRAVTAAESVREGDRLDVRLHEGSLEVKVERVLSGEEKA